MRCTILLFIGFNFLLPFDSYSQEYEMNAIKAVMAQQEKDWSAGNIEGFMEGYWKSDSLRFIGKKGIQYGWKNTLENYKKSYPDKAAMGKLSFEILHLEQLSSTAATMIGKWQLNGTSGNVGGHFTLLWKKIEGKWLIVSDHTS